MCLVETATSIAALREPAMLVAVVWNGSITGASVGDSGAWILTAENVVDLTQRQVRKPLMGSGVAVAVPFGPVEFDKGRLLLGSDGLLKYTSRRRIQQVGLSGPLEDAAKALINAVRLRSGALQDDTAVILCECSQ